MMKRLRENDHEHLRKEEQVELVEDSEDEKISKEKLEKKIKVNEDQGSKLISKADKSNPVYELIDSEIDEVDSFDIDYSEHLFQYLESILEQNKGLEESNFNKKFSLAADIRIIVECYREKQKVDFSIFTLSSAKTKYIKEQFFGREHTEESLKDRFKRYIRFLNKEDFDSILKHINEQGLEKSFLQFERGFQDKRKLRKVCKLEKRRDDTNSEPSLLDFSHDNDFYNIKKQKATLQRLMDNGIKSPSHSNEERIQDEVTQPELEKKTNFTHRNKYEFKEFEYTERPPSRATNNIQELKTKNGFDKFNPTTGEKQMITEIENKDIVIIDQSPSEIAIKEDEKQEALELNVIETIDSLKTSLVYLVSPGKIPESPQHVLVPPNSSHLQQTDNFEIEGKPPEGPEAVEFIVSTLEKPMTVEVKEYEEVNIKNEGNSLTEQAEATNNTLNGEIDLTNKNFEKAKDNDSNIVDMIMPLEPQPKIEEQINQIHFIKRKTPFIDIDIRNIISEGDSQRITRSSIKPRIEPKEGKKNNSVVKTKKSEEKKENPSNSQSNEKLNPNNRPPSPKKENQTTSRPNGSKNSDSKKEPKHNSQDAQAKFILKFPSERQMARELQLSKEQQLLKKDQRLKENPLPKKVPISKETSTLRKSQVTKDQPSKNNQNQKEIPPTEQQLMKEKKQSKDKKPTDERPVPDELGVLKEENPLDPQPEPKRSEIQRNQTTSIQNTLEQVRSGISVTSFKEKALLDQPHKSSSTPNKLGYSIKKSEFHSKIQRSQSSKKSNDKKKKIAMEVEVEVEAAVELEEGEEKRVDQDQESYIEYNEEREGSLKKGGQIMESTPEVIKLKPNRSKGKKSPMNMIFNVFSKNGVEINCKAIREESEKRNNPSKFPSLIIRRNFASNTRSIEFESKIEDYKRQFEELARVYDKKIIEILEILDAVSGEVKHLLSYLRGEKKEEIFWTREEDEILESSKGISDEALVPIITTKGIAGIKNRIIYKGIEI